MESEEISNATSLDADKDKSVQDQDDTKQDITDKNISTPDLDIEDNINNIGQVPLLQDVDTISSEMPDVGNLQMPQQNEIVNQKTIESTGNEMTNSDSTAPIEKNQSTNTSTFSLGVPGLTFSQDNVKTAPDGTKMVQIHQSQITPEQLESLQKNPNIKVVFRHIPSGRSFTKPPKHLLPKKRKKQYYHNNNMANSNNSDIYDFNEGVDYLTNSNQNPEYDGSFPKYIRYSDKKRGRPRSIPDPSPYDTSAYKSLFKSNTKPTQVIINELLGKLNKENAVHTIKIRMTQVTAEILANLELDPEYNISILTPEEELELDEKDLNEELEDQEEDNEPIESSEPTEEAMDVEENKSEQKNGEPEPEEEDELAKAVDDLEQKLAEEKKKAERLEAARLRKQKEEEELKKIANEKKVSRSGRIRKPSKYALDIARLTRKRNIGDSGDEETIEPVASPESVASPLPSKRKRGRPTKQEIAVKDSSDDASFSPSTPKTDAPVKDQIKSSPIKVTSPEKTDQLEKLDGKLADPPVEEKESDSKTEVEQKVVDGNKEQPTENKEENNKTDGDSSQISKEAHLETEKIPDDVTKTKELKETDTEGDDKPALSKGDLLLDLDEPESGEVDNKFRLSKLLEQCSVDEIRSVFVPQALDHINLGDFLLFKANQMHNTNDKVSFPKLYEQFESMHKSMAKEGNRYNVMVKRANKVGGDKRMDKVVLMPVYHREAAAALNIVTTSIDAHICGVQRSNTAQMIAANSFLLRTKMDPPKIHLKLPETTAPGNPRSRYTNTRRRKSPTPMNYNVQNRSTAISTNSSRKSWSNKSQFGSALKGGLSYKNPTTVHIPKTQNKTNGFSSANTFEMPTATLRSVINNTTNAGINNVKLDSDKTKSIVSTTTEYTPNTKLSNDQTVINASDAGDQFLIPDENAGSGEEVQKHLVPIGDGQFVELPEGYSLIQTDEGYIIGQPGSTFTQGEDGSLYITNSDGSAADITQVITTEGGEITTTTSET